MIVTIHQPDFLPWLGYFNKVARSDLLIIADHVQYRHHGFQNRNRIKTPQGPLWLSVPVVRDWMHPIYQMRIRNEEQNGVPWYEIHLRTIQRNYAKAPFYDKYVGIFEQIYRKKIEHLAEFNIEFLKAIFEILGIKVSYKMSREMNLRDTKTNSIVEICKKVGADTYFSGIGGTNYVDESLLKQNGITLLYNKYEHPKYRQQFMKLGFIEGMSIIDLIFNHGEESLDIVKSGYRGLDIVKSGYNIQGI